MLHTGAMARGGVDHGYVAICAANRGEIAERLRIESARCCMGEPPARSPSVQPEPAAAPSVIPFTIPRARPGTTLVRPADGSFRSRAVARWLNSLPDDRRLIGARRTPTTALQIRMRHVDKGYVALAAVAPERQAAKEKP